MPTPRAVRPTCKESFKKFLSEYLQMREAYLEDQDLRRLDHMADIAQMLLKVIELDLFDTIASEGSK